MSRQVSLPPAAAVLASAFLLISWQHAAAQTTLPQSTLAGVLPQSTLGGAGDDSRREAHYVWKMSTTNAGAVNLWADGVCVGTFFTEESEYWAWDAATGKWAAAPSKPPSGFYPVVRGLPPAASTIAPAATSPVYGGGCAGGSCSTGAGQRSLPRSPWWRRGR